MATGLELRNLETRAPVTATQTVLSEDDDLIIDDFPDGGFEAYSVVFGSFIGLIINLGIINSVGALQAYISTHQLASFKASEISWVFSIYLFLAYMIGIFIGPIFDKYGPRYLLMLSTAIWFAGFMGAASSTKIYHFILSFTALGVANSLGMTPCTSVLNHWFNKKSGNVIGLATSGGSVGGLFFPLVLRHTYEVHGYEWSIRILAFVSLGCMIISTILVKARFKREKKVVEHKSLKSSFDMQALKVFFNKTFIYICAGAFFAELLLVLLITYFSTYAIANGASESTAYTLVAVWNGVGILGRWLPGLLSDYLGRFNINSIMLILYTFAILVLLLPFGHNLAVMFVFAAFGGFFSGSILSLLPTCLAQTVKVRELGQKYGVVVGILSFANLFGVPLASAIINNGTPHEYDMFVVFVGCLAILGTFFWFMARRSLVGLKLNVRI